jgi:hypothetical protein
VESKHPNFDANIAPTSPVDASFWANASSPMHHSSPSSLSNSLESLVASLDIAERGSNIEENEVDLHDGQIFQVKIFSLLNLGLKQMK